MPMWLKQMPASEGYREICENREIDREESWRPPSISVSTRGCSYPISLVMSQKNCGNGPGRSDYKIDLYNCSRRLKALYAHWNEYREIFWGSSNVLAIATPPPTYDLRYLKSSAINIWLFGYEFPETIMIFGEKQIHFLCSQKKASLLEAVTETVQDVVGADILIHVKSKNEDGTTQMDAIFNSILTQLKSPVVGCIAKEAPEGKLLDTWADKLKNSGLQRVDITHGISDILALKDRVEIMNVRKAAYLTASTLKYCVVPMLEIIIDEEKSATHSSLSDKTVRAVLKAKGLNLCYLPVCLNGRKKATHSSLSDKREQSLVRLENVDICYPPIFESGGKFDLRPSAVSDDETLYYDSGSTIVCAVGSRYNCYCSNVARTFLFDPTSAQIKAYEVLCKAQEAAIAALEPGNKINAVYQEALAVVERDAPELVSNLTESAGTGIGIEFCESGLLLDANNDKVLKEGMVFNVSLGFQNLQAETSNPKSRNFSLLLADTVVVTSGSCEVATQLISKALEDVTYIFKGDEEEEKRKIKAFTNIKEALHSKEMLRADNQEKGKTREELGREASYYADMEKGDESDSEDEMRRKKTFDRSSGAGPCSSAGPSKWARFR